MSATAELVRCPECGAGNRVVPERLRAGARAVCGRCRAPLDPARAGGGDGDARPLAVSDASFEEQVLRAPLPTLVDLWAPWCPPCRTIAPVLEELAAEMAGKLRIAKLNVDDNPATAARLGVTGIPTLVLFRDGREVDRLVGALPRKELLRWARTA